MGLAPLPFGLVGRRKGAKAAELVQHGTRCRGVVVSVEDTNWTVNDNPRAGDHRVVSYDPSDPQNKNGITFDAVPGFDSDRPAPAPATGADAVAADDEADPLAKIEKLGELRDNGLITEPEFQMQKQRLLREV